MTHARSLIESAAHLDEDAVHVWHLAYRRAEGRRPLLRTLAAYLGIAACEVTLLEGAHGRPRLDPAHGAGLEFNWSHSGNHALIAIARGIRPGIDVERRRARPRALSIARRFFGSEEAQALAALPEPARDAAFLGLWTAKEAILKAHGRGIGYGLDRLQILSTPEQVRLLRFEGQDIDAWQVHRLAIAPDLFGALAWRGPPRAIQLGRLVSAGQ